MTKKNRKKVVVGQEKMDFDKSEGCQDPWDALTRI